MAEKKTAYIVTDAAGARPDIAGSRRKVGETIRLTEAEARYELSRGVIELPKADKAEAQADAPKADAKPASKAR